MITVGDTSDLIGRTITGQTSSDGTAIVENVFKFQIEQMKYQNLF